jgi:hypothetical protein
MEFTTSTRGKKMVVENGHKYILAYISSKNIEYEYLIDYYLRK